MEYEITFDGRLEIDVSKDTDEIHTLTFNLRRYVRRLFTFAYRGARQRAPEARGKVKVTMADVRLASQSIAYESDRKAVLHCQNQLLGIASGGADMICPFVLPDSLVAEQRRQAEMLKAEEHARARLTAAMTEQERNAVDRIAAKTNTPISPGKVTSTAPRRKRPPATSGSLLASLGGKRTE
jgi:hypothetical protein